MNVILMVSTLYSRLETRVRVSGVPVNSHPEDLAQVLTSVGDITKSEKYESRDGQTQVSTEKFCYNGQAMS